MGETAQNREKTTDSNTKELRAVVPLIKQTESGDPRKALVATKERVVKNLVLAADVFEANRLPATMGFSVSGLERRAQLPAAIAARMMPNQRTAEHAFVAAILHDIEVLCVDNEPGVLERLELNLGRSFAMTTATSGAQGLKGLRRDGSFALVRKAGVRDQWQVEIAGMVSQLGYIGLTPGTIKEPIRALVGPNRGAA